jgi:hypothetical protein
MAGIFCECSLGFLLIHSLHFKLWLGRDSLLVAGGPTLSYSHCFCQRSGMLYKLLNASSRVIVMRK